MSATLEEYKARKREQMRKAWNTRFARYGTSGKKPFKGLRTINWFGEQIRELLSRVKP